MKRFARFGLLALLVIVFGAFLSACAEESSPKDEAKKSGESFEKEAFIPPPGNTEQTNYNEAQKLYSNPTTILWCTVYPQANTSPIITIPVRGKLTSSTTTAFAPERVYNGDGDSNPVVSERSVDGLFHPNPPPYRYGFTPGNQYVDFFNLPTFCTTTPLKFQTESVQIDIDSNLNEATKAASDALESGDTAKAQDILKQAAGQ